MAFDDGNAIPETMIETSRLQLRRLGRANSTAKSSRAGSPWSGAAAASHPGGGAARPRRPGRFVAEPARRGARLGSAGMVGREALRCTRRRRHQPRRLTMIYASLAGKEMMRPPWRFCAKDRARPGRPEGRGPRDGCKRRRHLKRATSMPRAWEISSGRRSGPGRSLSRRHLLRFTADAWASACRREEVGVRGVGPRADGTARPGRAGEDGGASLLGGREKKKIRPHQN